jgi:hypothetical protein
VRRVIAIAAVSAVAMASGLLSASPALAESASAASTSTSASASASATTSTATSTAPYKAGQYIVRLKSQPAATYTGGVAGFARTKPATGKQLNAKTDAVKQYSSHLKSAQKSLANRFGVHSQYNYTLALDGFSADLTAKQATDLAKDSAVQSLTRSTLLKLQADATPISALSSSHYLKLDGTSGTWAKVGGVAKAGAGVVIGDIDSGIAPENPSFAGSALATTSTVSTTPSIVDVGGIASVEFTKADGGLFSSAIINDTDGWQRSDLSTKVVAARYFVTGFGSSNLGTTSARGEYDSPRDGSGHGSLTASTAAGDNGVDATVAGQDFGGISGVAPAAKIAVYKACWDGGATDGSLDGCDSSDVVAAIDQAVKDGVDVLNYSVAGGPATTTFSPVDEAFYNAASAGVFVAAAAGNNGSSAYTVSSAAPWETTVAATTIPAYEGTIKLGDTAGTEFAGASITVTDEVVSGGNVTDAPLVTATSIKSSSVTPESAANCDTGSLDYTKASGAIVICESDGSVPRLTASATVKSAGGAGMILVNTTPGAVADDAHTVPTIHVDSADRAAIESYATSAGAAATASFLVGNVTASKTPVPQVAGFSSRGPALADGSDILKPDVAAPGVGILAAISNKLGSDPDWGFSSGTSMAAPHVAGLALLYLGLHPKASVAEIKSALMTTATNTVNSANVAVADPFGQGDGQVNPTNFLSPGLLYLTTQTDWINYLYSTHEVTHSDAGFATAVAHDPSNLNLASIAIGNLLGTQKVTRTVTAQAVGTYTASISVPGLSATVSPSTLAFTKVGESKSFTMTFTRTTAGLDTWSRGALVWKKASSTVAVRSDIAIHSTSVLAASTVSSVGRSNSIRVAATTGANLTVKPRGVLTKSVLLPFGGDTTRDYTDTAVTGGHLAHSYTVAGSSTAGSRLLRFAIAPTASAPTTDLDLYVAYYASAADVPASPTVANIAPNVVGVSATKSSTETVDYYPTTAERTAGGVYLSYVNYVTTPAAGTQYAETFANLTDASHAGNFATSPTFTGKTGVATAFTVAWSALDPNADYVGLIFYSNAAGTTGYGHSLVQISTQVPLVKSVPTISGTLAIGTSLTGHNAVWDSPQADLTVFNQWLRDGVAITTNGNGKSYIPVTNDLGHKLTFRQTAQVGADGQSSSATSTPTAVVKAKSATSFTIADKTISSSTHAVLHVTVRISNFSTETGPEAPDPSSTLTIRVGSATYQQAIPFSNASKETGNATVTLPLLKKGSYSVVVTYNGGSRYPASSAPAQTLKVS